MTDGYKPRIIKVYGCQKCPYVDVVITDKNRLLYSCMSDFRKDEYGTVVGETDFVTPFPTVPIPEWCELEIQDKYRGESMKVCNGCESLFCGIATTLGIGSYTCMYPLSRTNREAKVDKAMFRQVWFGVVRSDIEIPDWCPKEVNKMEEVPGSFRCDGCEELRLIEELHIVCKKQLNLCNECCGIILQKYIPTPDWCKKEKRE